MDGRALEDIGLSEEEPITLDLNQISLGSFLRLLLRDLDLTYMVQDEVLLITSQEAEVQDLIVRTDPMNSLLVGSSKEVAALMQTTSRICMVLSRSGGNAALENIALSCVFRIKTHVFGRQVA